MNERAASTVNIRIAGIVRESIVDGPGIRLTVFSQGCIHACVGCHNEETHDFEGGYNCSVEKIVGEVDKNPLLQGVTFSGGEPICQPEGFYELAKMLKKRNLDVAIFTGFTYEELETLRKDQPIIGQLLDLTDYLIDGRFILAQKDLTLQFRGSQNQRYIDMNATREQGKIVKVEK